jgi:DNA-binding PadR family transcriptional regulator
VRDERLNATAGALLGLLRDGPRSGYELMAAADQVIGGFWTLTRSQVYRELAALADRGLLERGELGPRDRQRYRLTAAGRSAFRRWVNTNPEPENLRLPLLLRLTFSDAIDSDRLTEMLTTHRQAHVARLKEYKALDRQLAAHGVPQEHRVTLGFGISYEEAVLAWFDRLPAALTGRSPRRR